MKRAHRRLVTESEILPGPEIPVDDDRPMVVDREPRADLRAGGQADAGSQLDQVPCAAM